jgi:hypothetical protein
MRITFADIPDRFHTLASRNEFVEWVTGLKIPVHHKCELFASWKGNIGEGFDESHWAAIIGPTKQPSNDEKTTEE